MISQIDILLIEDREEDAELTKLALFNTGFKGNLKWIKDGEQAIDFLFDINNQSILAKVKFILLDLNLPKINGIEILKQMKNSPLKRIPIIVLTTSQEDKDLFEAYDNYVNSYLLKPVIYSDFETYISRLGQYWMEFNVQLDSRSS